MPTAPHFYLPALLALTLALSACKKDNGDNTPVNEEEVITTVVFRMSTRLGRPNNATTEISYTWRDTDGTGGNNPTIDTIRFYRGENDEINLKVEDESTPGKMLDITPEIRTEENVHQFFYHVTGSGLAIRYDSTDYDTNMPPKPVGLQALYKSDSSGRGSIRIVLKHQPDIKPTINNTVGDENLGETDVEVVFPYVVR